MSEFVEELTIEYFEDGEQVIEVLEKEILTKGAWATIVYLYREIDRKTKEWKAPAARVVRYRKMKGVYRQNSKFNISSGKQALQLCALLQKWFKNAATTENGEEEGEDNE